MKQGFYCLIQYCPDASRAEAANVGLVVFQTEPPATAVRIVDDAGAAMKRLGQRAGASMVLRVVQSTKYRIEREQFQSLEALEKFVRTRGNQIQLTMPRPMRIDAIERDAQILFTELVTRGRVEEAQGIAQEPLLRQTFQQLAERLPDRVSVDRVFHVRDLGIPIQSDYAYENGCLNIIREVPLRKKQDALCFQAMGLSKEGELARDLDEGEGKLVVVPAPEPGNPRAMQLEQEFGDVLRKLGGVEFVSSSEVPEFTKRVEAELAGH